MYAPHRTIDTTSCLTALVACGVLAGCGAMTSSAVVGLPKEDFDRAYAAGYDVAAAEHCGAAVDPGLVRHNLIQDMKRRGLSDDLADKAGRAFDKTRAEFARKARSKPDFCVTEYAVSPETLALYQKGEFSAAR